MPRPSIRVSLVMALVLSLVALPGAGVSAAPDGERAAPGGPSYLSGPRDGDAVEIALDYLLQQRSELGLSAGDIADVAVTDSYVSQHTGVTHVYLVQRFEGIEVVGARVNINVAPDGGVMSLGGSFVSNLQAAAQGQQPERGAAAAVRDAARQLGLAAPAALEVRRAPRGQARDVLFAESGISQEPIPARLVYEIVGNDRLRLAWEMEIYEPDGSHWWNVRVDARTGEILARDDYGSDAAPEYEVFALPKEHPNDGPRTIEIDPADGTSSPFGWHDTDGASGPEFTVTRGNNVHAYTDIDANNVPDPGSDPDCGAELHCNFALDLTQQPGTYRDAAVANLFYWNNIVHDVFYGYGFDEPAGNFQVNNYGNGGAGGDDVRAEAQDGSGLNNANFFTPTDGNRPRMQMFIWRYPFPNLVTVNTPAAIAGDYTASGANFGPSLSDVGPITADVVYVGRGCDPAYQPDVPLDPYLDNPDGAIALIDRGVCTFASKVHKAQDNGAVAVIVANNLPGSPITMGGANPAVTIPSVMISLDDGNLLKDHLDELNVTLRDAGALAIDRDSDLDAGVIVHEYGHGISNRLTGGPSVANCLNNAEQMGEGWSDWLALVLTTDPADAPETVRGIGTYVIFQEPDGNGIRPTPYTTDMAVNPTTYGDIGSLAIPHGVGYAWSSMLWEIYWNLVAKHGYNADVYGDWTTGGNNLAIQLVMDGMKLQACRPGFVDGRDAILLADQALTGGANHCEIWSGFVKRGLGFSADQGSNTSTTDGTEAFDLPPTCANFSGFIGSVKDPPTLNRVRAGAAVALTFSLAGDQGLDIFAAGYPQTAEVDCDTRAPTGPFDATMNPGGSGLTYDATRDRYTYPWQTLGSWAGTCRIVVLQFTDGVSQVAYFRLR
jgi:extracellular elastinolytic metalloproteinase